MSQLPEIDASKVSQRLNAKVSELTYTTTQLEILAEALRDERDEAREQLREMTSERDSLLAERDSAKEEDPSGGV